MPTMPGTPPDPPMSADERAQAMDRFEIILPGYSPPSPNKTAMAHWSKVRQHKRRALELVTIYAADCGRGRIPRFDGPVRVEITRFWGKRQRALDPDNLQGSVKPLVDALRAPKQASRGRQGGLGIIADDDPGNLELVVDQEKSGDGTLYTRIVIEGRRTA